MNNAIQNRISHRIFTKECINEEGKAKIKEEINKINSISGLNI